jgi:hypothetical protein
VHPDKPARLDPFLTSDEDSLSPHAVALLASPLACFINGANLRVDGGAAQSVN